MSAAIPERLRPLNEPAPSADPSTSHAKIKRGLANQTNAPIFPHLKRGEALPAEAELEGMTKSARELFASIKATTAQWSDKLATHRQGKVEQLEAMLSGLLDEGYNTHPGAHSEANAHIAEVRQLGLQKIDADLAPVRKLIADADNASIADRMKRLTAAREKLARWREAYPSPLAMLESYGLGNPQRATYIQNIAHAGPGALRTLMQEAISKNDVLMAAAIAVRVGELDPKDQPFSAHQVANAMLGDVYAKFTETARAIDLYVDGSDYELRSYAAGGEVSDKNLTKIKNGLAQLEAEQAANKPAPPLPKPSTGDVFADDQQHLDAVAPGLKGTGRLIAAGVYRADMTPDEIAAAVAALDADQQQNT